MKLQHQAKLEHSAHRESVGVESCNMIRNKQHTQLMHANSEAKTNKQKKTSEQTNK